MPAPQVDHVRELAETLRSCGVLEVHLDDEGNPTRMVMRHDITADEPDRKSDAGERDGDDGVVPLRPDDPLWKSTGHRIERVPLVPTRATADDDGDDDE